MRWIFHRRTAASAVSLAMLLSLCGCFGMRITDDTETTVSIRYDGVVQTLKDATAAADAACAKHGKKAQYRSTDVRAALERFAHFNCVSG